MNSEVFAHFDSSPSAVENGGSLAGKRAAVQSLIGVRGWPTAAGSKALGGFVPLEDATVVQRLRAEGALLVGNTPTSELGLGICGDGAARAVPEGQADVALMLDTLGEARVAAARAGLCGFKPSWGRVSRFGLMGLVPSMECCSLLARNPKDLARVFQVVQCMDECDPSMVAAEMPKNQTQNGLQKKDLTAGIATRLIEALSPEERSAFFKALAKLQRSGVAIREVKFEDEGLFSLVHQVIGTVEASSSCGKYDGVRFGHRAQGAKNWNEMYLETRRESFSPLLKTFLFQGAYFQFENYPAFENACRIRARLVHESRKLFESLDLMLLPTQSTIHNAARAQSLEQLYNAFSLTLPANVTGQPALSLPGLIKCGGQDTGLQVVGPFLGDEKLLSWAQTLIVQGEEAA